MAHLHPSPRSGFTLIEVLVALAVFSIIGTGAFSVLTNLQRAQEAAQAQDERLADLQHLLLMTQHDVSQITWRAPSGTEAAGSVQIAAAGLGFARQGWRNPLNESRSTLAWLRYDVNGGHFIRELRPFAQLSRPQPAVRQMLANQVEHIEFHAVQPSQATPAAMPALPAAIEVSVVLPPFGEIRELVPLVQTP